MRKKIIQLQSKIASAVRVKNLGKTFQNQEVLNGLSLEILPGKIFALMGPSGCGKTTLLRLIAGLEKPDWGEIYLKGKLVSSPNNCIAPNRRSLSMVFQDLALWPHMTIRQHLDFGLNRKKYKRNSKRQRIEELLGLVHLGNSDAYPHQLSGGQKQRLAIARALASDPEILLLDEPLSNLDVQLKQTLIKELKNVSRHLGITILYVTHQPEEAAYLGDYIATVEHGCISAVYSPVDFIKQQKILWEPDQLCGDISGPHPASRQSVHPMPASHSTPNQ